MLLFMEILVMKFLYVPCCNYVTILKNVNNISRNYSIIDIGIIIIIIYIKIAIIILSVYL